MTKRGRICILKEILHLQPVICVCCRKEHSSLLYVCVRDASLCACFFSPAVSMSSAYRVLLCSVFQCFLPRAAGPPPVEQDGRPVGWLAAVRHVV